MRGPGVGADLVAGLLADISIAAMSAMIVQVFPGAVRSHHGRSGLPIASAWFPYWLRLHNCTTAQLLDRSL